MRIISILFLLLNCFNQQRANRLFRSKRDEIGWNKLANTLNRKIQLKPSQASSYADQYIKHLLETHQLKKLRIFMKFRSQLYS